VFGWSLHDIDETDIESLIPVVFRFPKWKETQKPGKPKRKQVFADQAEL
jgi:hypothetical protein